MNSLILAEVQKLKLYLQKYPKLATKMAVNHLEDYLVLFNECKHLEEQIALLRQSNAPSISLDLSINTQLTLEQQFHVEALKRSLVQNPHKSHFWAVEYFKFTLLKSESYLEMRTELISLQNQPSLPYFL